MSGTESVGLAIAVECFEKKGDETDDELDTGDKDKLEFIYKTTMNNKCIIFCNSRYDTEFIISNLKKLAEKKHTKDVYRVHHGSVSAVIREDTEREMKLSEESVITGG